MIFVEIFHDFGWFCATRIRIRFIEADPDPTDQNETDPDPKHCINQYHPNREVKMHGPLADIIH